ncbi:MAG: DnaJ domain-containing protein [Pseudomonadota bacterium]
MLGAAVRTRTSGILKVRSGQIVRQLVFRDGSVILAASNARSEVPGAFLQREGRFTVEQFNRHVEEARKTKTPIWELAAREAALTAAEEALLKPKYVVQIAKTVFTTAPADVEFQPGDVSAGSAASVHGVRLLIDAASDAAPGLPEGLCPDLLSQNRIAVNQVVEKAWGSLPLGPEERGLLTVVRNNSSVAEVRSASFLGEPRITRLLLAFWLAGLVSLERAAAADLREYEAKLSPTDAQERRRLLALHARRTETTYYEWLSLSPKVSLEEVRRAGSEQIEKLASPQTERLFLPPERKVLEDLAVSTREALAVLQNPPQRREYDAFLASGRRGSFASESKVGREHELLREGARLLEQGNTEEALRTWADGISELPGTVALLTEFARAALKAGKASDSGTRTKVTSALKQALEADARNAVLYEVLGEWMEALGQPARAIEAFRRAASFAPHSRPAQNGLLRLDPKNAPLLAVLALKKTYDQLTYYALLGIAPSALLKDIQAAYRQCTRRFHPDRFFKSDDAAAKDAANAIYKRMVKAYTTLKSPEKRAEYDMELKKGDQTRKAAGERSSSDFALSDIAEPPAPPKTQQGRKFFDLALIALRQGNVENAKLNLKLGLQVEPEATALKQKLDELGS